MTSTGVMLAVLSGGIVFMAETLTVRLLVAAFLILAGILVVIMGRKQLENAV